METLKKLIKTSQPTLLLAGLLFYGLGVGISRYLGVEINWYIYLIGQLWVLMLQLGAYFLYGVFIPPIINRENVEPILYDDTKGKNLERRIYLILAFSFFAILTSITIILLIQHLLSPLVLTFILIGFLGAVFYSLPPFQFIWSGYGELLFAILMAFVIPSFAFILQSGNLHRLVGMITFPLVLFFLASVISEEFPTYARDVKYEIKNVVVRMGWRNSMNLYIILILIGFLVFALASLFGLPRFALYSGFLALPLGVLQIYQIIRIENGSKPNWKSFNLLSKLLVGLFAYFIAFSFWIH